MCGRVVPLGSQSAGRCERAASGGVMSAAAAPTHEAARAWARAARRRARARRANEHSGRRTAWRSPAANLIAGARGTQDAGRSSGGTLGRATAELRGPAASRAPRHQYARGDAVYRARHGCHSSRYGETFRGTASPSKLPAGVRRRRHEAVLIGAAEAPRIAAPYSRSPRRELRARQPRARPRRLILHGSGVVRLGDERHPIATGDVVYVGSHETHHSKFGPDRSFPASSRRARVRLTSGCSAVRSATRSRSHRRRRRGHDRRRLFLLLAAGRRPVHRQVIVSRSRRCCSGGRRLS